MQKNELKLSPHQNRGKIFGRRPMFAFLCRNLRQNVQKGNILDLWYHLDKVYIEFLCVRYSERNNNRELELVLSMVLKLGSYRSIHSTVNKIEHLRCKSLVKGILMCFEVIWIVHVSSYSNGVVCWQRMFWLKIIQRYRAYWIGPIHKNIHSTFILH